MEKVVRNFSFLKSGLSNVTLMIFLEHFFASHCNRRTSWPNEPKPVAMCFTRRDNSFHKSLRIAWTMQLQPLENTVKCSYRCGLCTSQIPGRTEKGCSFEWKIGCFALFSCWKVKTFIREASASERSASNLHGSWRRPQHVWEPLLRVFLNDCYEQGESANHFFVL